MHIMFRESCNFKGNSCFFKEKRRKKRFSINDIKSIFSDIFEARYR